MEKENKIMKLGFIGTGNMAGAIMGGIIRNEIFKPEEIIGADISKESRSKVQSAYGINVTEDNKKAASESEVLVLSVKPQYYAETITERRLSGWKNSLKKRLRSFVQCRIHRRL